jgi:hypothetical protein
LTKTTALIDFIFEDLIKLIHEPEKLPNELLRLGRKQPNRVSVWFREFDEAYDHYKKTSKLSFIASFLLPHLQDTKSLLDFGCGDGEIAAYLVDQLGLKTASGVDILDWRSPKSKNNKGFIFYEFDFTDSDRPVIIPQHDTGLMHAMLHHVSNDPNTIKTYLQRARTTLSRQLLIVEDVLFNESSQYAHISGIQSLVTASESQPNFEEYLRLAMGDQKDVITILDLLSNSLAMGVPEMNFPFGAQELSVWLKIFEAAELKLSTLQVLGLQNHLFHRMSQVLFVLHV